MSNVDLKNPATGIMQRASKDVCENPPRFDAQFKEVFGSPKKYRNHETRERKQATK